MDLLEDSYRKGNDTFIPKVVTLFGTPINFCPICATPRPVEKTLEEKFRDWFVGESTNDRFCSFASEQLAKLAEEHYRGKV